MYLFIYVFIMNLCIYLFIYLCIYLFIHLFIYIHVKCHSDILSCDVKIAIAYHIHLVAIECLFVASGDHYVIYYSSMKRMVLITSHIHSECVSKKTQFCSVMTVHVTKQN